MDEYPRMDVLDLGLEFEHAMRGMSIAKTVPKD
jgi:hypothetical protein